MRRSLEQTGLVIQSQVLDPLTGRYASCMEVTPRGWEWAEQNMGGTFANSPTASETLSVLLSTLSDFLHQKGLRLADLFACKNSETISDALEDPETLLEAADDRLDTPAEMIDAGIVRQILTLSCGRSDVTIPLRSLRRLLDIHRIDLDDSLRRLHRTGRIEFMRTPNPDAMPGEDQEAVLYDEHGNAVHKVKLARQLEIAG